MITIKQLEDYTQTNPKEVLIVKVQEGEEVSEIMIFKGFSSSLTGATAFDPDMPIVSEEGKILTIDRLLSPYNPTKPLYIQKNLSLDDFIEILNR